ncbi:hypothetical protein BDV37DRAFT_255723 [Aspergillus pseudonomiae]|uniref:UDP-glucose 6-dehydrogenase n=1 Tax=Aspergillus pseudonomiae TaxID=1506151 RepID=A0A5N7D477_9EURO|nr:uncharacterized protein BDV37DRAFT_255723 [Aspergillus pseudonomiae]KAE8401204.1 hypothetical protein BDV37DRAFT_255723 [Aspergillus pseudonomiae]
MMPFLPILLVLAGLTFLFRRRRYKAIEQDESPRVVVKGHTYSDNVEEIELPQLRREKVENVRKACMIGAGYVGGLTALVLASQNPHIQFSVVDSDARLIAAWNSDRPPVFEPGLEDLLFEPNDPPPLPTPSPSPKPEAAQDEDYLKISSNSTNDAELVAVLPRRRKLANVSFSTNMHEAVAAADMVFLCVDAPSSIMVGDKSDIDLSRLEIAIQAIAQVSTGHKIIVQKSTAPCGIVPRLKKLLKETASPSASFDVLSNPDFLVPGAAIRDLLYPPRVIIGHVFSEDMSPEALTALKRLYSPWVPDDRIVTMDAWSSELGKLAANALLAQQISSLNSLSVLCESTNANINYVSETLGLSQRSGLGFGGSNLQSDVLCLVYLARELGLQEVVDYWMAVLRMNEYQRHRVVKRLITRLGDVKEKRVAVLGFVSKGNVMDTRTTTALGLVRTLTSNGVRVNIYDPHVQADRSESTLRLYDCHPEMVTVTESIETACFGCSALVLHTDWEEFRQDRVRWQRIAGHMASPKVLLDPHGVFDGFKMQQWGFEVLQVGIRSAKVL